ncbi:MAG TPA: hypothetical protein VGD42_17580 [Lysobacter sp.]
MSTFNAYEPPKTRLRDALSSEVGDCWRDGRQLVVRPGCTLPGRCIKCNEPAEQLTGRSFYWHHPGLYVVALLNLLIYAVIALVVRKRTRVTVGLCRRHRSRRLLSLAVATVGTATGLALLFMAFADESYVVGAIGSAVTLASLVFGIVGARVLVVARIGENYTRFDGAGTEFLDTLPAFYRTR